MAKWIAVTARLPFEYQGRWVAPGEALSVLPIEAAILNRQQAIRFGHPPIVARDLTPEPEPQPATREALAESASDVSPQEEPPRRKRRYRRRDLTAEPA